MVLLAAGCLALCCTKPVGEAAPVDTPETLNALAAQVPAVTCPALVADRAASFAALSLACIERPFPNKPGHIYAGEDTFRPPRELTPAFYGCYDWHSAVHGHWAMLRVLKTFPGLTQAPIIRKALNARLSRENLSTELAFFREDRNATFERPYGWGWYLRLAAELAAWNDPDGLVWLKNVKPLAEYFAQATRHYLRRLSAPLRDGTHSNTAFALVHALDYARVLGDTALAAAIDQRARDFYFNDRGCPTAYEPSGEDFISPCLVEADLMRRILAPEEFQKWFDAFMPPLTSPQFQPLLAPLEVRDRQDPRLGHLIGLAFQRAWAMDGIAAALPSQDPRGPLLKKLAQRHCHEALRQMFDSGYNGEHWLASFALYDLSEAGLHPPARAASGQKP